VLGQPGREGVLRTVGKLTAFAGRGTWILSQIGQWVLSGTMPASSATFHPHQAPLGWLAGTDLRRLRADPRPGVAMRAELDSII
jgi:hypothetical protein